MEKEQRSEDVSRLIQGSMRPYDERLAAAGVGGAVRERRASPRMDKLRSLLNGELILNVLCVLLALMFLGLAASNVSWAGSFFSIDSLFLTAVCLMLAGVFLVNPALTLYEKGAHKRLFAGGAEAVVEEGPIHFEGSTKLFLSILGWLLGLTVIEVFLAYIHVPLHIMLTVLIGLSLIKAALIVAYFMHLRFERMSLVLTLVPILVICICLLFIFFPDSNRSFRLRSTHAREAPTATEAAH